MWLGTMISELLPIEVVLEGACTIVIEAMDKSDPERTNVIPEDSCRAQKAAADSLTHCQSYLTGELGVRA